MSGDMNRVILIGRLTRDPELRETNSGTSVASFSIANNRSYSVSGEKKEDVSFFDCVAWGKLGEIITEYCGKGQRIAIEGRMQQRQWDDQEGNKRSKIEVVVENFQFLSAKGESSGIPEESGQPNDGGSKINDNPFSDDDIPF